MAKPKITRLSDPTNPYNQKKSPTGRPQDKPKPSASAPARKAATPAPAPKRKGNALMGRLNDEYNATRRNTIDAAVDGKRRK